MKDTLVFPNFTGTYKDGKKEGAWVSYDQKGKAFDVGIYKGGKKVSDSVSPSILKR